MPDGFVRGSHAVVSEQGGALALDDPEVHELRYSHEGEEDPEIEFGYFDLRKGGEDNEEGDSERGDDDAEHHVHEREDFHLAFVVSNLNRLRFREGVDTFG